MRHCSSWVRPLLGAFWDTPRIKRHLLDSYRKRALTLPWSPTFGANTLSPGTRSDPSKGEGTTPALGGLPVLALRLPTTLLFPCRPAPAPGRMVTDGVLSSTSKFHHASGFPHCTSYLM